MSNSFEIAKYKNDVILELINNEQIVNAINAPEEDNLIYTHIFPYQYVPDTQTVATTYITMTVDIPRVSPNNTWVYPRLTLYIICHQEAMELHLAGINSTRIDYLSSLIDTLFNNSFILGYGQLQLVSNIESSISATHRYRKMVFDTIDLNNNVCGA